MLSYRQNGEKGQSYEEVLYEGVKNVQKFVNEILLQNGFAIDEMKTRNYIVKEERKYDKIAKNIMSNTFYA